MNILALWCGRRHPSTVAEEIQTAFSLGVSRGPGSRPGGWASGLPSGTWVWMNDTLGLYSQRYPDPCELRFITDVLSGRLGPLPRISCLPISHDEGARQGSMSGQDCPGRLGEISPYLRALLRLIMWGFAGQEAAVHGLREFGQRATWNPRRQLDWAALEDRATAGWQALCAATSTRLLARHGPRPATGATCRRPRGLPVSRPNDPRPSTLAFARYRGRRRRAGPGHCQLQPRSSGPASDRRLPPGRWDEDSSIPTRQPMAAATGAIAAR